MRPTFSGYSVRLMCRWVPGPIIVLSRRTPRLCGSSIQHAPRSPPREASDSWRRTRLRQQSVCHTRDRPDYLNSRGHSGGRPLALLEMAWLPQCMKTQVSSDGFFDTPLHWWRAIQWPPRAKKYSSVIMPQSCAEKIVLGRNGEVFEGKRNVAGFPILLHFILKFWSKALDQANKQDSLSPRRRHGNRTSGHFELQRRKPFASSDLHATLTAPKNQEELFESAPVKFRSLGIELLEKLSIEDVVSLRCRAEPLFSVARSAVRTRAELENLRLKYIKALETYWGLSSSPLKTVQRKSCLSRAARLYSWNNIYPLWIEFGKTTETAFSRYSGELRVEPFPHSVERRNRAP